MENKLWKLAILRNNKRLFRAESYDRVGFFNDENIFVNVLG